MKQYAVFCVFVLLLGAVGVSNHNTFAQTSPLSIFNAYVSDSFGNVLTDPSLTMLDKASCNQQMIITTNIKNSGSADEQFKLGYVIYDSVTGNTVYTQTQVSTALAGQTVGPSINWATSNASTYKIQITLLDSVGNQINSVSTIVAVVCDASKTKDKSDAEKVLPTVNKKEGIPIGDPDFDLKKQSITKDEHGIEPSKALIRIKELISKLRSTATDEQKQILDELEKAISSLRQTPKTDFGDKAKTTKEDLKSKIRAEKDRIKETTSKKKVKDIKDATGSDIAIDESGAPKPKHKPK